MEPRIQYAKTSDGVSIAFWTLGEGLPFVHMPQLPLSHIQLEWHQPEQRRWYERLAEKRMLIRYDARGFGLSERAVTDFSLDALVLDLEAVVSRLGIEKLVEYDVSVTPTAVAYAVRHPERVSHLVLWDPWTRVSDWRGPPAVRSLRELLSQDWEAYTETFMHVVYGWEKGEVAHQRAERMRQSVTVEDWRAFAAASLRFDITELIPLVQAPTLVMTAAEGLIDVATVSRTVARIPDARLLVFENSPVSDYTEVVGRAIDEFLAEGHVPAQSLEHAPPSGTAVILFADIADSTALTERLGDAAFRAKARELGGALRAVVRECSGTPVEGPTLGDGVLAVFTSAREAIAAALVCGKAGDDAGLPLHLGLHAGDVTREKDPDGRDNVYGGAVNVASRISGLSAPGEVLVSETVRSLARTSAGVRFEDRGEQALKGVGEAVRVWAVRAADS